MGKQNPRTIQHPHGAPRAHGRHKDGLQALSRIPSPSATACSFALAGRSPGSARGGGPLRAHLPKRIHLPMPCGTVAGAGGQGAGRADALQVSRLPLRGQRRVFTGFPFHPGLR